MKAALPIALLVSMWFAGCAGYGFALGRNDAALKSFAEADELLSRGEYASAARAYAEIAAHFPSSGLADDAYLRIVQLHLYRTSGERGWTGWTHASVDVARDTLAALLLRFPDTDRRFESRGLLMALDALVAGRERERVVRDSLGTIREERRDSGTATSALRMERGALVDRVEALQGDSTRLREEAFARDEREAELRAELDRVQAEAERMRRVLIDLQRRSESER